MSKPLLPAADGLNAMIAGLPSFSASKLVAGMQKVISAVMTHGAVLVTRHEEPVMVLLSVDRYLKLQEAAAPNLEMLTRQFDTMFTQMQGVEAARRMADAFAMTPAQLGEAAARAAK